MLKLTANEVLESEHVSLVFVEVVSAHVLVKPGHHTFVAEFVFQVRFVVEERLNISWSFLIYVFTKGKDLAM